MKHLVAHCAIVRLGVYSDPALGWSELMKGGLELYEIPGYRLRVLQEPRVRILAEQLRACLDKAQNGPGARL